MTGAEFINHILRSHVLVGQRTGQFLFNQLPAGARNVIAETPIDPFHKNLDTYQLTQWIQDHLIFGGLPDGSSGIIGVFYGKDFVWVDPRVEAIDRN